MNPYVIPPDAPDVVMPTCKATRILKGQKALVTGANSGIGKGAALALDEAGADVMANYFSNPEAAEEVVETIRGFGSKAVAESRVRIPPD